jgi:hypothetical protein
MKYFRSLEKRYTRLIVMHRWVHGLASVSLLSLVRHFGLPAFQAYIPAVLQDSVLVQDRFRNGRTLGGRVPKGITK